MLEPDTTQMLEIIYVKNYELMVFDPIFSASNGCNLLYDLTCPNCATVTSGDNYGTFSTRTGTLKQRYMKIGSSKPADSIYDVTIKASVDGHPTNFSEYQFKLHLLDPAESNECYATSFKPPQVVATQSV